jgi:Prophage minor tail protein Z (GPZ)
VITVEVQGESAVIVSLTETPELVTRAMVRAQNRAIVTARTTIARLMAEDLGMPIRRVVEAISLRNASIERPEARIGASAKRIPLIDFDASGPEPSRGKGRGVSYRLNGGRARIPSGFIATMRSGHRGVFVRKPTAGRLPIQELKGPSLGKVFAKYRPEAIEAATASFKKNFDHELSFAKDSKYAGAREDVGLDLVP